MDWSKSVVSRGFGQSLDDEALRPDQKQAFKSGEVSYFFGNYSDALERWTALAEQGYAKAQANIGWMYQAGLGVEKNIKQARGWYEKAASQGHAVAQNNLGVLYENGLGVAKNLEKAYELYLASAQNGYRFGQYNVAKLIADGRGTERNLQHASRWLKAAADQGVEEAKNLMKELGVENNETQNESRK